MLHSLVQRHANPRDIPHSTNTITLLEWMVDCAFLDVIITLLWAAKGALCLRRPLEPALLEQRMG
eukprot:3370167-Prorocentrum_lima.AAC.1